MSGSAIDTSGRYAWGLSRLEAAQRKELLCALIETAGNQSATAESLGISRPTCRAWMERYHVHQWEWKQARTWWGIETTTAGKIAWRTYPNLPEHANHKRTNE